MGRVTLSIDDAELHLRAQHARLDEVRAFGQQDRQLLVELANDYDQACEHHDPQTLRAIGERLANWLDGSRGWLDRLLEDEPPPLVLELAGPRRRLSPEQQALLSAPWELLLADCDFLAADRGSLYAPVRRLARRPGPAGLRPGALSVLFMAGSPRGIQPVLDFEAEEMMIVRATAGLPLDLFVEPMGSARALARHALTLDKGESALHVIHLNCHGDVDPNPCLLLEDDSGDPDFVEPARLIDELGELGPQVGLLFLSACWTAATAGKEPARLDSLTALLTRAGFPAVLGWAAPVGDAQAVRFAAELYGQLARGDTDLELAVARARQSMLLGPHSPGSHWHLSRLFVGRRGGGRICEIEGPRRRGRNRAGDHLDPERTIPVAGRVQFMGRRREIQRAVVALRDDAGAGVLILGPEGYGKSSLAERLVDRMGNRHTPVVVGGRFGARKIIDRIGERLGTDVNVWRYQWRSRDDAELGDALRQLLDGAASEGGSSKPILLVLDGFEAMLEAFGEGHRVAAKSVKMIEGLLQAFVQGDSRSRLLLTSSADFSIVDELGRDLSEALIRVTLTSEPRRF